jgi:hypothetical protein
VFLPVFSQTPLADIEHDIPLTLMRALRKGQAAIFNLTRDILGEARLVERAFGLGASALTEAVQLVGERLEAA